MEESFIRPTVGRIVHYYSTSTDEWINRIGSEPLAAIITAVHSDTCVNLTVFASYGDPASRRDVLLVQPCTEIPESGSYCTWMPYQVRKSFGSESGEKAAGTESV